MLIDTHAHLFWDSYEGQVEVVLTRAKKAGVEKIIVPGTDIESSETAIKLSREYPGVIWAGVGIHPEEVVNVHKSQMNTNPPTQNASAGHDVDELRKLIEENREQVVAIGEVGMDLTISNEHKSQMTNLKLIEKQGELFREQCRLALEYDLPVIIHTRESVAETLAVLDSLASIPRGQFHCFSGTEEEQNEILSRGFYMSFCGNVSWSKRVRKMSKNVPNDRLLTETDSPFMTPVNENGEKVGKINEPANVRITSQIIATAREITVGELEKITCENAHRLFGI